MKRSQINQIMQKGIEFFSQHQFVLPPFATWTVADWQAKGLECEGIVTQQLGWDITDFGSKDFYRSGLLLFTIRNGSFKDMRNPMGKSYSEKIMIVEEDQFTPVHFHFQKMEDIINRGGGTLMVQVWNSDSAKKMLHTPVIVQVDSIKVIVEAGGIIELKPGSSVCFPQRLYHKFWGKKGTGKVLVGEVSRMNDDYIDNYFYDPIGRFSAIEEDEEPLHLLYIDYQKYYPAFNYIKNL